MHEGEDLSLIDLLRIESDESRCGSQVDHGGGNGAVLQQRLFQPGHAGGAVQTADPEGQLSRRLGADHAEAQGLYFFDDGFRGGDLFVETGAELRNGKVDDTGLNTGQGRHLPLDAGGAVGTGHTGNLE